MQRYPHLFRPLQVRGRDLPNRLVMGAMHTRLETLDRSEQRLAAFYAERARGEIGLILTGGHAPVPEGVMDPESPVLQDASALPHHRAITRAVHEAGGRIVLQILHAGRYARVPNCVAPSPGKARINTFAPRALSRAEVWDLITAFAHTARLAEQAGYDGVEIMGSEGYLINEFTSAITNQRDDEFGGDFVRRLRLPLEIVRAVRAAVGEGFWIVYRISAIDLMAGGMTADEVAELARAVQAAGADILNTGVGWHESAVPTIAAAVPRAAWVEAVRNLKRAVQIPVMASNRINTPEVAESILASGAADLVSMARPLLADPAFARKARLGEPEAINTCIACNQACLDAIFTDRTATCLVNPRAGRELDFTASPSPSSQRIAVVGAGPAGMSFAIEAAQRGHRVSLWERHHEVGGQLNLARQVPGKREFDEMLRYFRHALVRAGVELHLGVAAQADALARAGHDLVVVATGVTPRRPDLPGIDHPKVVSYVDVLQRRVSVGERVAILGAGGIGFDVAAFLLEDDAVSTDTASFMRTWGVDLNMHAPGGVVAAAPPAPARRQIHMFQRKPDGMGRGLGKSTGWIHKAALRRAGVTQTVGVTYLGVDDAGLHYRVQDEVRVLDVDHVVLCTGQRSERTLADALQALGVPVQVIGGAHEAAELDALRAIEQATRLALSI